MGNTTLLCRKVLLSASVLCLVSTHFLFSKPIQFEDVTAAAGVKFVHNNGAAGKKYLPETMGSGCAFLDYNNDGWLDLFLVNSSDWPGPKRKASPSKLYRNNKDGTFTDVTRAVHERGARDQPPGRGCVDDGADWRDVPHRLGPLAIPAP